MAEQVVFMKQKNLQEAKALMFMWAATIEIVLCYAWDVNGNPKSKAETGYPGYGLTLR